MSVRTVHFGLGPIGREVLRMTRPRGWASIVGAVDVDERLVGVDAGEHAGDGHLGIPIARELGAVGPAGTADVVVQCTGSRLAVVEEQILDALAWGASVVSTCEELAYPWYHNPDSAQRIDAAAQRSGRTVLGTGVNPGWAMDTLALYASGAAQRVESIHVRRVVDASMRRAQLQAKIGAGISTAEFERRRGAGEVGHVGLVESVAMVAAACGWTVDSIDETLEPIIADTAAVTQHVEVEPGQVAGIRQRATARVGDTALVVLDMEVAIGAADPGDTIYLAGDPDVTVHMSGVNGDHATAAIVVNALSGLDRFPSGLASMADAAIVRFRP